MAHTDLSPKLVNAVDEFIAERLPGWLRQARPERLTTLRERFTEHQQSQRQVQAVFSRLEHPDAFARGVLEPELDKRLGLSVDLAQVQWRERLLRFDAALNTTEFVYRRSPALQRLMQNFSQGEVFYPGTALVHPDTSSAQPEQVLFEQPERLVALCRELDAGKSYQQHLDSVFDEGFTATLALEKRRQLALAMEIADMQDPLDKDDLYMLRQVRDLLPVTHVKSVSVSCGELKVLGARVDGALVFELRGSWKPTTSNNWITRRQLQGVILYDPDDAQRAFRHYTSWREANLALGVKVRDPGYREALEKRIGLQDRASYLTTLATRLQDDQTDMDASFSSISGELFEGLARAQLQRIRDDARFLLVPTAKADASAAGERLKSLKAAGLVLLNLAGLFVPGVGALLLADMARQTLAEVFEGVRDWSLGRQHEALGHLLEVAQTLALTGGVVATGNVVRSAFVDAMVPVSNPADQPRLWSQDLAPYADAAPPADLQEQANGLLSDGQRYWWRDEHGIAYPVSPLAERSVWRLRHRTGDAGFAPELVGNGERAWRLAFERPLEWEGERRLLARLWPQALNLDEARVGQILKVADIGQAQLRGLLVEGRRLPVALRDTLERFAVSQRIEAFFSQLHDGLLADAELLQWCVEQLNIFSLNEGEQAATILACDTELREGMLERLSERYLGSDPHLTLLQRDFPGLPKAYALRLLEEVSDAERQRMVSRARLPLGVAERARRMLRHAQLTRTREGLYLPGSYRAEVVELVFALLSRHAGWPMSVNLVLREGSDSGRVLARLYPESASGQRITTLVWRGGRFSLSDADGRALDIEPARPEGLPEVLAALLPDAHRQRLGWEGEQASARILDDLRGWLPADDQGLARLLGLRPISPWHVPLQRTMDGRPGYALNGRRSSSVPAQATLRDRVRSLYPGFNDREVDTFVQILLERPGTAFSDLLRQEQAYRELDRALQRWTMAERSAAAQARRRLVADELQRAWRLECERLAPLPNGPMGMRLSLIGIPVGSLPELPAGADFEHITDLQLIGLGLGRLPTNFLRSFPQLRRLNLSNNALRVMPADIGRLGELHTLSLAHNQVRLDATSVRSLRGLAQLRTLDLSHNTLGSVNLDLRQVWRLRELGLRGTGIREIPSGLEWCGFLEHADLRQNQIARVPASVLNAPYELRQALDLTGNPLPAALREQLYAPFALPEQPQAPVPPADVPGQWLRLVPSAQRVSHEVLWDALRAEPGSDDLFQLLDELTGSSDFRQAREDLARRVWAVLEEAGHDSALREQLFSLAAAPRTCVDSVASSFSALEVRVFVARALRESSPSRAAQARLHVARRLFRLDQVERIARADIEARRANDLGVDEVEVSLAYRTGLAAELDLPGQPRTMQFQTIAGVTEAQLTAAAAQVRAEEAGDGLAQYISQRDFWVAFLRSTQAARFQAVEQPFWDRLDALEEEADLSENDYLTRMNQLARDREQAQQTLLLTLTEEALAGQPATSR